MDNGSRYRKDFDLIMEAIEAKATRREKMDRTIMWKFLEKPFNDFAQRKQIPFKDRERIRNEWLDLALSEQEPISK